MLVLVIFVSDRLQFVAVLSHVLIHTLSLPLFLPPSRRYRDTARSGRWWTSVVFVHMYIKRLD